MQDTPKTRETINEISSFASDSGNPLRVLLRPDWLRSVRKEVGYRPFEFVLRKYLAPPNGRGVQGRC
jgi:hypothetical protein